MKSNKSEKCWAKKEMVRKDFQSDGEECDEGILLERNWTEMTLNKAQPS